MPTTQPPEPEPARAPDDLGRFWELAAELFCVLDVEGRFVRVNPAWTRVLGWQENELVGHLAFDFIHPDDRAAARDMELVGQLGEHRAEAFQNRYRHKDGSIRWLSWSGQQRGDRWFGTGRDVTATRTSHEALQRSERRSRAMLAALREGLLILDSQFRVVETNARFAAMVGLEESEIIGARPPFVWWPLEAREQMTAAFTEAARANPSTAQATYVRSDGTPFPVLIDVTDLADRDGLPASLAVIRDVSELVGTRDRLAQAHRVAGLVAWEAYPDRDLVITYANALSKEAESSYSMTLEESLEYVPEPTRSELRRLREEVMQGLREGYTLDIPVEGSPGAGWVEVRAEPIRAPDGRITGLRGTAQAIDARRRATMEAQLQSDILDAIDIAVIARGPDQRLVFANEAAVRLLGWSQEDLADTTPDDLKLIATDEQEADALITALKAGEYWHGELTLRRRDASLVRAEVRTAVVRDGTGTPQYAAGIVVAVRDDDGS